MSTDRDHRVSVIVPCRNEGDFIGRCLDSVFAGAFPLDRLEVLVVDGASDDGTREIAARYAQRYTQVRLLDNPAAVTPAGLNIGVGAAAGDVIARLDAHATYGPEYLSRCVAALDETGADVAGGVMETVARDDTAVARAIVAALVHPFGAGGSSFRRPVARSQWTATVFCGCYRRDVFARVGGFNEALVRGQDMEFHQRLRRAGGRIWLVHDAWSRYYARTDLPGFLRHAFGNGKWAVLPFRDAEMPVRPKHLVPLAFVLAMSVSVTAWAVGLGGWGAGVIGGGYAAAAVGAAGHAAWRRKEMSLLWLLPPTFALLHLAYGFGSLWGATRLLGSGRFWRRVAHRVAHGRFRPVT